MRLTLLVRRVGRGINRGLQCREEQGRPDGRARSLRGRRIGCMVGAGSGWEDDRAGSIVGERFADIVSRQGCGATSAIMAAFGGNRERRAPQPACRLGVHASAGRHAVHDATAPVGLGQEWGSAGLDFPRSVHGPLLSRRRARLDRAAIGVLRIPGQSSSQVATRDRSHQPSRLDVDYFERAFVSHSSNMAFPIASPIR